MRILLFFYNSVWFAQRVNMTGDRMVFGDANHLGVLFFTSRHRILASRPEKTSRWSVDRAGHLSGEELFPFSARLGVWDRRGGQQRFGIRVLRFVEDLVGVTFLDHFPEVHNTYLVADIANDR